MYLKYLQYFITVAECRNFSRAAEKLNTVQPSISRQIKKLEEIVGTPLIIRSPHELELTSSGEVFLEQSKIILKQFEQAKTLAREAAMISNSKINVGLISGTEQPFFEKVLTPAKNLNPNLVVNITTGNELDLVENVKDGKLDAGFLIGCVDDPDLKYHTVCKQDIVAAISATSPLASKNKISIKDLVELDLYLPKDDSPFYKSAIKGLLDQFSVEKLNVNISCDGPMSAMQSICINHTGCCFILDFQSHFAPKDVIIKQIDTTGINFNTEYELVLITSKQNQTQSIDNLVKCLQ